MHRSRLGADGLIDLGVCGELRRYLIGGRGNHPGRWGRRSRVLGTHRRPGPLQGAGPRRERVRRCGHGPGPAGVKGPIDEEAFIRQHVYTPEYRQFA